nr:MAG TPA: hypothetical protein [Caudoviricetes sp.]
MPNPTKGGDTVRGAFRRVVNAVRNRFSRRSASTARGRTSGS